MSELSELGRSLTYPSILCLWIAVLVRIPGVVRSSRQRGLWLAVVTATVAMTLHSPAGLALMSRLSGSAHLISLSKNLFGVLSAGAVLYFVTSSTGGRRLRTGLCFATGLVLVALPLIDALAPAHGPHGMPPAASDTIFSLPYWQMLMASHLAANAACVFVCWRYGRRANTRSLRVSLYLFALGTLLAALYWLALLLRLVLGIDRITLLTPLVMNLHGLLRAAAILVPVALLVGRTAADIMTAWRLWPVWRDLVDAVPHVALTDTRARLLEILWPPVPRNLLIYRRVIETRDAILVLNDYAPEGSWDRARRRVAAAKVSPSKADAVALAYVLRSARTAKLAGCPQRKSAAGVLTFDNGDLEGEKAFLLDMARAYVSAPAQIFAKQSGTSESS
ncbi:MAB_1171c family putative transporter [Streptomyces griseus]|uniref:MAB_1171c family putative transporter n=1 Tax=Streptomyces griseus TaxID=1911 RepID=UPI0004C6F90F|nr:MAB_1171c family putative transporter [Streptomyces griseus]